MAVVLVVDDEFGILRLLEDVLVDEGHIVVVAVNGSQALERARMTPPDLVLTDFMMPVLDGPGLIVALRAEPALADVPVVVMSSLDEAAVAERCPVYAAFVRKPFKLLPLVDLVTKLVGDEPRR